MNRNSYIILMILFFIPVQVKAFKAGCHRQPATFLGGLEENQLHYEYRKQHNLELLTVDQCHILLGIAQSIGYSKLFDYLADQLARFEKIDRCVIEMSDMEKLVALVTQQDDTVSLEILLLMKKRSNNQFFINPGAMKHLVKIAACRGHVGSIVLLMRYGFDFSGQDVTGFTLIKYSIFYKNIGLLELMLKKGVTIQPIDVEYAVQKGERAIVRMLLQYDPNVITKMAKGIPRVLVDHNINNLIEGYRALDDGDNSLFFSVVRKAFHDYRSGKPERLKEYFGLEKGVIFKKRLRACFKAKNLQSLQLDLVDNIADLEVLEEDVRLQKEFEMHKKLICLLNAPVVVRNVSAGYLVRKRLGIALKEEELLNNGKLLQRVKKAISVIFILLGFSFPLS